MKTSISLPAVGTIEVQDVGRVDTMSTQEIGPCFSGKATASLRYFLTFTVQKFTRSDRVPSIVWEFDPVRTCKPFSYEQFASSVSYENFDRPGGIEAPGSVLNAPDLSLSKSETSAGSTCRPGKLVRVFRARQPPAFDNFLRPPYRNLLALIGFPH